MLQKKFDLLLNLVTDQYLKNTDDFEQQMMEIQGERGEDIFSLFVEKQLGTENREGWEHKLLKDFALVKTQGELQKDTLSIFLWDATLKRHVYVHWCQGLGGFYIYIVGERSMEDLDFFLREQKANLEQKLKEPFNSQIVDNQPIGIDEFKLSLSMSEKKTDGVKRYSQDAQPTTIIGRVNEITYSERPMDAGQQKVYLDVEIDIISASLN